MQDIRDSANATLKERRSRIILQLVNEIAFSLENSNQLVQDACVRAYALAQLQHHGASSSPQPLQENEVLEHEPSIAGLTETDLEKWMPVYSSDTRDRLVEALESKLDQHLLLISRYWAADGSDDKISKVSNLAADVTESRGKLLQMEDEALRRRRTITDLTQSLRESTHILQTQLIAILDTLHAPVSQERRARFELLVITLQASHLKLTLLHARAQQSLYGHQHVSQPHLIMTDALANLHRQLKDREEELAKEEEDVDRRVKEYDELLARGDGKSGTSEFRQILEGWRKVKRENGECRRDLRRLGWTGD